MINLARARYAASKRHPYVAEALFSSVAVPDENVPTVRFAPGVFQYNAQFFADTPLEGAAEAVAHEMGHFIFNTVARARRHQELHDDGTMVAADPNKFWFAGCLAVNDWLRSVGWAPVLVPESVGLEANHTSEWYYDHLPSDSRHTCACALVREDPDADSGKLMRAEALRAAVAGSLPGTHPSDEVLSFLARYQTRFDWSRILFRSLIGAHDRGLVETPTFTRPSRRQGGQAHVRLTGRRIEGRTDAAVILDTSGSITDEIRGRFAGVLRRLMDLTSFYLVTNDATVHAAEDVYAWRDVLPMVRGGGGTDFCPAFEHLAALKRRFTAIYVLTDGYAYVPGTKPKAPVYWLIHGDGPQPATWGTTIRIEGHNP